jgi:hypothetical protein
MPIRPSNRIKPKTIQIHDQHGQSAFNPSARIRSNELEGATFDVVAYVTGSVSG